MKSSNSLGNWILKTVLVIQICLAPLFMYIIILNSDHAMQNAFKENVLLMSRMAGDLMERSKLNDPQWPANELDRIVMGGSISYSELQWDGQSLYSKFANKQMSEFKFIEDSHFGGNDDQLYYTSLNINTTDKPAILRLGFDESTTAQLLISLRYKVILIGLLYTLILVILLLRLSKSITNPLSELKHNARQISEKIMDHSLAVHSKISEVNELSESLENMRCQLYEQTILLSHMSRQDSLTGLPNRAAFAQTLERCCGEAKEFHVMIIDLDKFKEVNDNFGHPVGDKVLQDITELFQQLLEENDFISRMGGDEFALILYRDNTSMVMEFARQVIDMIEKPIQYDELSLEISASIGVASFPEHGKTNTELLRHADYALYYAKDDEGNTALFNEKMALKIHSENILRSDLGDAMEQGQLSVHYQPKVNFSDERICSVEALLRWNHPELGFIPPPRIISIAEQTGLIDRLTFYVLNQACKDKIYWRSKGFDLKMAVNIEPSNLLNANFADKVLNTLTKYGVNNSCIELELTENNAIKKRAIDKLSYLSKQGISIAVDDFGTGYSSLSYLWQLPVSTLKLDRSFIQNLEANDKITTVVKASVALAHLIGLKVVAEGVETEKSKDMLKSMKCDFGQGYLYSKAIESHQVLDLLHQNMDMGNPATEFS